MAYENNFEQKAQRLAADLQIGNRGDATNLLRNELATNPREAMNLIRIAQQQQGGREQLRVGRDGSVILQDSQSGAVQGVGRIPQQLLNNQQYGNTQLDAAVTPRYNLSAGATYNANTQYENSQQQQQQRRTYLSNPNSTLNTNGSSEYTTTAQQTQQQQRRTYLSNPNSTLGNSTLSNPNSTLSNPNSTLSNPNSTLSNPNSTLSNPNSTNYLQQNRNRGNQQQTNVTENYNYTNNNRNNYGGNNYGGNNFRDQGFGLQIDLGLNNFNLNDGYANNGYLNNGYLNNGNGYQNDGYANNIGNNIGNNQVVQRLAYDLQNGNQDDAASTIRQELSYNPRQALAEMHQANLLAGADSPDRIRKLQDGSIVVTDSYSQTQEFAGRVPVYNNYNGNNYNGNQNRVYDGNYQNNNGAIRNPNTGYDGNYQNNNGAIRNPNTGYDGQNNNGVIVDPNAAYDGNYQNNGAIRNPNAGNYNGAIRNPNGIYDGGINPQDAIVNQDQFYGNQNGQYNQGGLYNGNNQVQQRARLLAMDLRSGRQNDAANILRQDLRFNPQLALNEIRLAQQLAGYNSPERIETGRDGNVSITDRYTGRREFVGRLPGAQIGNYYNNGVNNGYYNNNIGADVMAGTAIGIVGSSLLGQAIYGNNRNQQQQHRRH